MLKSTPLVWRPFLLCMVLFKAANLIPGPSGTAYFSLFKQGCNNSSRYSITASFCFRSGFISCRSWSRRRWPCPSWTGSPRLVWRPHQRPPWSWKIRDVLECCSIISSEGQSINAVLAVLQGLCNKSTWPRVAVAAQQKSTCHVAKRSWVWIPLGARLFPF